MSPDFEAAIDGATTILLKTEHFRLQPGYSETISNYPAETTYTDGSGFTLQRCALSERKDYRITYARRYQAGRLINHQKQKARPAPKGTVRALRPQPDLNRRRRRERAMS